MTIGVENPPCFTSLPSNLYSFHIIIYTYEKRGGNKLSSTGINFNDPPAMSTRFEKPETMENNFTREHNVALYIS